MNLGRKVLTCLIKLHSTCPKEHFWVEKNFWKFWFFSNTSGFWTNIHRVWRKSFQQGYQIWKLQSLSQKFNQKTKLLKVLFFSNSSNFERTFTVFGEKLFGRDIKIENCSFCLKRSIKKPNFWKFWCFFKLFRFLNEHSPCLAKKFSAGISKMKIAVFVSKDQSKNQTSESSDVFSNSSGFWTNIHRAWRKSFGQGYQTGNCTVRLIRSNKKPNFWKIPFFSKSSELWTSIYRALRKSFGQGYQTWKLYSTSSEYQFEDKNNFFWKFGKFSFVSDLEHEVFGFVATEVSPGLSKLYSTWLYEFSLRCWC